MVPAWKSKRGLLALPCLILTIQLYPWGHSFATLYIEMYVYILQNIYMQARQKRFIGMVSPEHLFQIGGLEHMPCLPQPGLDPPHDAKHNIAYERGDAAVDSVILTGGDGRDLDARNKGIAQIMKHVIGVEDVEVDRRRIAEELNKLAGLY